MGYLGTSLVENATFVEHQLHDAFDNNRTNPHREFFQISPERVVAALKLAEIEDISPKNDFVESKEDQKALNQARAEMRAKFNFKMADIPIGAELVFSRDENIKAKVVDNKFINFDNEIISLSASAQKILGYNYGVQGTAYWIYEGETLDERRKRLESEE